MVLLFALGAGASLSTVQAQVIRKNYREMTAAEKQIFVNALNAVNTSGIRSLYADNHSFNTLDPNNGESGSNFVIHNDQNFLPWHRWFIYYFEQALRNSGVQGASKIALPYWDWTSRYYSTAPTDRVNTAPLWASDFLGQFNTPWSLNRSLGTNGSLPSTTQVDGLASLTLYSNFASQLEGQHNSPHVWVGGLMNSARSPLDPVFYLHHAMIDKIWQDWYNLGRNSTVSTNNNGTFPSGVPGYPGGNPNNIVDGRVSSLKVWYAENGQVKLNKYTVSGTENYRYTGTINAEDNFTVPSSTNCTMVSAANIVLKPGFVANSGSAFRAYIDVNTFNSQGRLAAAGTVADKNFETLAERDIEVFPNPSDGRFQILLLTGSDVECSYQVTDLLGKVVTSSGSRSITQRAFELNLQGARKGIYLVRLLVNQKPFTRKIVIH